MGQAIATARETIKVADEAAKKKAQQDFDVLQKAMNGQLQAFENELDAKFLNPLATQKLEVPGIRALRKKRFSTVCTKNQPSTNVSSAIDSFFKIGDKDVDKKTTVKEGFKTVVTGALSAFLGNAAIGETTAKEYFIYMQHNSIVRLDVMLWQWKFSNEGFSHDIQTAIGYVVCDGEAEVVNYMEKMVKVYNMAREMKLSETKAEKEASQTASKTVLRKRPREES